jgi:hypothetical protein
MDGVEQFSQDRAESLHLFFAVGHREMLEISLT